MHATNRTTPTHRAFFLFKKEEGTRYRFYLSSQRWGNWNYCLKLVTSRVGAGRMPEVVISAVNQTGLFIQKVYSGWHPLCHCCFFFFFLDVETSQLRRWHCLQFLWSDLHPPEVTDLPQTPQPGRETAHITSAKNSEQTGWMVLCQTWSNGKPSGSFYMYNSGGWSSACAGNPFVFTVKYNSGCMLWLLRALWFLSLRLLAGYSKNHRASFVGTWSLPSYKKGWHLGSDFIYQLISW